VIKNSVASIPLTEIDVSTIDGSCVMQLPESCFMLRYVNRSDRDIVIGYHNIDQTHELIPAHESVTLTFQATAVPTHGYLPEGTYLYASCKPDGKGSLYIIGYYFVAGR
jgi:hypothetical protein